MRIISLQAANFKRLRAVEIKPQGSLVEIRGKNGAGKSSVLDAIESALGGGEVLPQRPIRRGAETARIRLDLGELIVTRRFRPGASDVVIEAASGARFRSPQRMLDDLIGAIAFDPLEFTREKPAEQLQTLRGLVKIEVDVDALDGQNARDYEARTDINREAKKLRGQASGIHFPEGLPAEPIDIAEVADRLRAAGEENTLIERRRARRDAAVGEMGRDREAAAHRRFEAKALRAQADDLDRAAAELETHAAEIQRQLDESPALPEPVGLSALVAELDRVRGVNEQIEAKLRRETLEAEALALEQRAAILTTTMQERTEQKERAIAKAEMPVAGLGFGDGEVLYDGLPFDQASQAEKIRISVAIAMAMNPKLKVLCVRDGSLLDRDSWQLLAELVTSNDYQCWVEVTDDDAKTGIIIEDGAVRGSKEPADPESTSQPALALEEVN